MIAKMGSVPVLMGNIATSTARPRHVIPFAWTMALIAMQNAETVIASVIREANAILPAKVPHAMSTAMATNTAQASVQTAPAIVQGEVIANSAVSPDLVMWIVKGKMRFVTVSAPTAHAIAVPTAVAGLPA